MKFVFKQCLDCGRGSARGENSYASSLNDYVLRSVNGPPPVPLTTEGSVEQIFCTNNFNEWILGIQYSQKNCHCHYYQSRQLLVFIVGAGLTVVVRDESSTKTSMPDKFDKGRFFSPNRTTTQKVRGDRERKRSRGR